MSGVPLISDRLQNQAPLKAAVHRRGVATKQKLLDRLFTFAFSGLVYPQIWEDPVPDLEALALQPDSHLVTIASGGCNVLSYLSGNPARITAVDLNHAHIALTELKIAAVRYLPDYQAFRQFFRSADSAANIRLYDELLAPKLGAATRAYWEASGLSRKRRISIFSKNAYRFGLLGYCIRAGHLVARVYGANLKGLVATSSLDEQKAYFDKHIAPLFDKRFVRWAANSPMSLYGLGIPPAQYKALSEGRPMADVLRERLERLAAGFPADDNYFAWQAFVGCYPDELPGCAPLYLQEAHFETLRARIDRVGTSRGSVTRFLGDQAEGTVDAAVLLDAQDWMTAAQLNDLWSALSSACRPGARVIFRTAGRASILPGQVDDKVLDRWAYDEEKSADMLAKDRSAIYGGFHLYRFKG